MVAATKARTVVYMTQVLYEFAADAGSMERSRYFGFSKARYAGFRFPDTEGSTASPVESKHELQRDAAAAPACAMHISGTCGNEPAWQGNHPAWLRRPAALRPAGLARPRAPPASYCRRLHPPSQRSRRTPCCQCCLPQDLHRFIKNDKKH